MNYPIIRAQAQKLIDKFEIKKLPVDPFHIAQRLNISTHAKPPGQKGGVSGALIRSGNNFGILYSTNIPNIGYQRFTVAHEIGHFVLEGHIDYLQLLDGDTHYSKPGFYGDKYEREADYFAASLLMPEPLFTQAMSANKDGMDAIKNLAEKCKTSLTATAIRYIEETDSVSAIVVSERNKILYSFFSDEMANLGVKWLRRNSPLPINSLTYEINHNDQTLHEGTDDITMQDWFDDGFDAEWREEVKRLGNYEKTLTVLTFFGDHEDILEDERIVNSWNPQFSR